MEFVLNNAPELTMLEITKKLFNNKFLSNIEFTIEGTTIYAHSLELMKRSIVFEKEFESVPNNPPQIIHITNCTYKIFFEFIRFIYTDDCNINIDNSMELFRLAMKYKVVKLENQVLDFLLQRGVPLRIRLMFYAFCLMENYRLPYNVIKNEIARNLNDVMELSIFPLVEANVMEDILKLDCVDESIKEVQIFNGLIRWMNKYCETNQIDLTQRRDKFVTLLQLIRYPHMTMEEFRGSVLANCDLFADNDICLMFKDLTPIPKRRKACEKKYDRRNILNNNTTSETKFKVLQDIIFTGFRYGAGGNHEIKLFGKDLLTNNTEVVKLNKKFKDDSIYKTVSLGESLILKPDTEYLIQIVYDNGGYTCWCVSYRICPIIIHDPLNMVELLQPGVTMFEIFFKQPNETSSDHIILDKVEVLSPTDNTHAQMVAEKRETLSFRKSTSENSLNQNFSEPPQTEGTIDQVAQPNETVLDHTLDEVQIISEPPMSDDTTHNTDVKEEISDETYVHKTSLAKLPSITTPPNPIDHVGVKRSLSKILVHPEPLQTEISVQSFCEHSQVDSTSDSDSPQGEVKMAENTSTQPLTTSVALQDRLTAKLLEARQCKELPRVSSKSDKMLPEPCESPPNWNITSSELSSSKPVEPSDDEHPTIKHPPEAE